MSKAAWRVDDFIGRIGEAVSRHESETETVSAVKRVLTSALESPGWLPERCRRPAPDCYARHLLYRDPRDRFAVVVMVWRQGQKTPIHNHGGVWCVEGVYEGRIHVKRYEMEGDETGDIVRLHESETISAGIGETGALIPPVDHHSIENAHDRIAVTIHTYGCDMKSCQVYVPRTDGAYDARTKQLVYTSLPES